MLLIARYVDSKHTFLIFINLVIAILFNPFAPIYLNKAIWAVVDLVVALYFLIHKKEINF